MRPPAKQLALDIKEKPGREESSLQSGEAASVAVAMETQKAAGGWFMWRAAPVASDPPPPNMDAAWKQITRSHDTGGRRSSGRSDR